MTKPALRLDTDVQYLKGVGPKLGSLLSRRGIKKIEDLLNYYPRAYEDRRAARNIGTLRANDVVSLKAMIVKTSSFQLGRSTRKMYDILIRDSSGQIHCKFFRVPYKGYFERFGSGKEVRVVGKVTDYRGRLEFHHPDVREIDPEEEMQDALIPIYTEIENLSSAKIARLTRSALEQLPLESWGEEKFPKAILEKYHLVTSKEALSRIHCPEAQDAEKYHQMKSEAHHRIIFEELFWLELYLAARKSGLKKEITDSVQVSGELLQKFFQGLPFQMTNAQKRAFAEIKTDLAQPHPMHRLVQGDVGSGKTLVALAAAVLVSEAKRQTCLMVPTEILAEQHYKNAVRFLGPLDIRVALLTGKTKAVKVKEILRDLEEGKIHLLIGTHALIEERVKFQNLSLVIVDEQHRFGVEQRGELKSKGRSPHFLIMTATPIPRTLSMTVYGDLDVSIIDEMPPGRSPIETRVAFETKRKDAFDFMKKQIEKGRQAYVVYPLVEESEKIDLKNAMEEFERLQSEYPDIRFGLLHGRMKAEEKEGIMTEFREGKIQALVSTTVIEVGVDVANANIMIIEHAERFGLSQLHQLRGRVGRGEHKSFCILLMGYAVSEEARQRTYFMEKTTDGFKIAEFDLEMRGPGEFLGTKQSGLPGFRLANLVRDLMILQDARAAAFDLLKNDPNLKKPENKNLREELLKTHGVTALAGIA